MNPSYPLESLYQEELYVPVNKVLVVLPSPWESINESDQQLLSKILGSIKIRLASVQVVTFSEFHLSDVEAYKPSKIITFGAQVNGSKGTIKPYQPYVEDKLTVLQADSLDQLDEARKKNLWSALKEMFGL